MTAMQWPDHLLSLEEWDALPEDNTHRYELVEGNLLVSPKPVSAHQVALFELGYQLRDQLPSAVRAVPDVEVVLSGTWPPTVRAPDLIVVPAEAVNAKPSRFQAEDVSLAVEIISPGSRRTDRLVKFAEYADAGIPRYWIVDLGKQVTLAAFELVQGEYKLIAEGTGSLRLSTPVEVVVDLDRLC